MPVPAPRAVTPRGRRRSWGEPGVRLWWLTALVLAAIAGTLTIGRLLGTAQDRRLVREGRKVEAKILKADHLGVVGQTISPEADATFTFDVELDGKRHEVSGKLKQQREPLGPGKVVTLYVDPNDPSQFTDRTEVAWRDDLFVLMLIAPVITVLVLVALVKRTMALRAWRDGEAMAAVVVETKQSASAPLSRLVRYTLRDVRDNRVFSTVVPTRVGTLNQGDTFWVVGGKGGAVVAALYA